MPNLGGWEFVILIGVLVLLFGAKRLPDMARSIGQSARVFKGEMKGMKDDDEARRPRRPPPRRPAPPAVEPRPRTSASRPRAGEQGPRRPAGSRSAAPVAPHARWPGLPFAGARRRRATPTARCRSSSTSTSCATG